MTNSEIGKLIGRKIIKLEKGESEVSFEMTDAWLNMQGILHGGAFATMLDTACGAATRSLLDMEKYRGHATLELKTSYLKAGRPGQYIAKGRVLRMGRSVAYSEASCLIVKAFWFRKRRQHLNCCPNKNNGEAHKANGHIDISGINENDVVSGGTT